jgi:hypothetical protein
MSLQYLKPYYEPPKYVVKYVPKSGPTTAPAARTDTIIPEQ